MRSEMRSTDVCHQSRYERRAATVSSCGPRAQASLRPWCFGGRCVSRRPLPASANRSLRRPQRALCSLGTTASDHPPLTLPSPCPSPPRLAFARRTRRARPRSLFRAARESGPAWTTRSDFDRTPLRRADACAIPLAPAEAMSRFCHRGSPPDVASPGAISRFGLSPRSHPLWAPAPVKGTTLRRARVGADDVDDFDLCDTTRCVVTPLFESPEPRTSLRTESKSRRRTEALSRGSRTRPRAVADTIRKRSVGTGRSPRVEGRRRSGGPPPARRGIGCLVVTAAERRELGGASRRVRVGRDPSPWLAHPRR